MDKKESSYKPHIERTADLRETFTAMLRERRLAENAQINHSNQIDRQVEMMQQEEEYIAQMEALQAYEEHQELEEEYYANMIAYQEYLDSLPPEEKAQLENQTNFLSDSD